MSSPSESFECHWRPSRLLLATYLLSLALALAALLLAALPAWAQLTGVFLCGLHALWTLPRHLLLRSPTAVTALRRDASGWHLFSTAHGWQAVRLLPYTARLLWHRPKFYRAAPPLTRVPVRQAAGTFPRFPGGVPRPPADTPAEVRAAA